MRPQFVMRCTVARHGGTGDTFGQAAAASPAATSVPCYWWSGSQSRSADAGGPGVTATESEHVLFAPGTDVRQGDQITTVTDHLGDVVFAAVDFRVVEHVAVQRNHIDCTLRFGRSIGGRS